MLYGVCGLAAALSLLLNLAHGQYAGLVAILFCAAAWIGIQRLGYIEFNLAGRLFRPRTFRRLLDAHIQLRTLEDTLAGADTADQCWAAVRRAARDLGFNYVTLSLDHVFHEERFGSDSPYSGWTVNIPLSETEFVKLGQSDPMATKA